MRKEIREQLDRVWETPKGWRMFSAVNNNFVGPIFIASSVLFLFISGGDSLLMRAQLAVPENDLVDAQTFNQLFTTHGTAMMFLFAVPILEAIAIYTLPLMLGTRDMPFPRMSAFTIWTFLFGGLLFYSSTLPDIANFVLPGSPLPRLVPDVGWFAYPPLSAREYSPGLNVDFYLLGLGFAEFAGIAAAIEIIVSVLKMRAPGMSLDRLPLFAWSLLVTAFAILFAFPAVIVGTTYLELQRKFGLPFFDPAAGGDPLLWQHLFWIFGHPEVYIMFIPATGIVSMLIPAFTGRPIAGYAFIATAIAATGFFSFGLWVHHMFTVGLPVVAIAFFGAASMMITFPSGVQTFAWLATMVNARRLTFDTPMLYVIGFIVTFVLGGLTGVMVASVPFDLQVHDTHFVTAHFHYVLAGGVLFPILGGFVYWWPKVFGRLMDEAAGRWIFWTIFTGFNLAFLPQHWAGLLGMPRRVYTYPADLGIAELNLASTVGAFLMGLGIAAFAANGVWSLRAGRKPGENPWRAGTLEWSVASPTPNYNHGDLPLVRGREPLRDGEVPLWKPERTRRTRDEDGPILREALIVSALDGRPEAISPIAGPSWMPLSLAVTFTIVSVGLLFEVYWVGLVFSVFSIPIVIRWMWPSRAERELGRAGATLADADLPVHVTGPRATGWWCMLLTILALGVSLGLGLFSHLYLVYGGPGTTLPPRPPFDLAALRIALLLLSLAPVVMAERAIARGRQGGLRLGLAAGAVIGAAVVALEGIDVLRIGLRPTESAIDAMIATLVGYQIALGIVGLSLSAFVQVEAWLGYFDRRRRLAVQNVALFWGFVVFSGIVVALTVYALPHLL